MKSYELAAIIAKNIKVKGLPSKREAKTKAQKMLEKEVRKAEREAKHQEFLQFCDRFKIPAPVREHKFDRRGLRGWLFDYAWPEHKVAMEIEGGAWIRGRHTRPKGFIEDKRKYSEAAVQGWRIIYTFPDEVTDFATAKMIRRALHLEES